VEISLEAYFQTRQMTKAELARRCDISPEYVTQLSQGLRRPSPDLAAKISAVTGGQVSVKDLLYPEGFPPGAVFDASAGPAAA
jgi:DNA-binding transcriptional regulator YdaS (Cro superfamily)